MPTYVLRPNVLTWKSFSFNKTSVDAVKLTLYNILFQSYSILGFEINRETAALKEETKKKTFSQCLSDNKLLPGDILQDFHHLQNTQLLFQIPTHVDCFTISDHSNDVLNEL